MTPLRALAWILAGVLAVLALAYVKQARSIGPVTMRLDIVEMLDSGGFGEPVSRGIVTFDYSTPIVTAYVRQDRVFGNGFDQ